MNPILYKLSKIPRANVLPCQYAAGGSPCLSAGGPALSVSRKLFSGSNRIPAGRSSMESFDPVSLSKECVMLRNSLRISSMAVVMISLQRRMDGGLQYLFFHFLPFGDIPEIAYDAVDPFYAMKGLPPPAASALQIHVDKYSPGSMPWMDHGRLIGPSSFPCPGIDTDPLLYLFPECTVEDNVLKITVNAPDKAIEILYNGVQARFLIYYRPVRSGARSP